MLRPAPMARPFRLRATLLLAVLAAAALAGACHEIGSDPNAAVSMSFDTLPAPSVVVGDSMRDSAGGAVPLHAHAYNTRDAEIAGAPFRYFTSDSLSAHVSADGYLIADSLRPTEQKVFAQLQGSGIPARSLPFHIVQRPDSMVSTVSGSPDTLYFTTGDTSVIGATALGVKVLHVPAAQDTAPSDTVAAVGFWIVRYAITYPADTTRVLIVDDAGHAAALDTTDATGSASRKLRFRPTPLSGNDSVVVEARASYRGNPLRGAPVRFVIQLSKVNPTP